jgi:hypothetical protein
MPDNSAVALSYQREPATCCHARAQPINESGDDRAMVAKGRHVQTPDRREIFVPLETKLHDRNRMTSHLPVADRLAAQRKL